MANFKTAMLALPLLLDPVMGEAGERLPLETHQPSDDTTAVQPKAHLSSTSTIGDILRHPSFSGFGRMLLPWDNRSYDEKMTISDIGSLLPYHSHVHTPTVLGGLNRIIDDATSGRKLFYDFYSEAERRDQPTKANTGLFFFRGKPGAPFAIVAPGGGFAYVGSVHEGFPYAVEINRGGYNVFVLRYRPGQGGRAATEDLASAISFIFKNSKALDVATAGYSLWGSSAGARMAAAIGSHGAAAFGGADLPGPAAVVLAYTAHSDHSNNEPPTFVMVGADDGIAPPSAMESRIVDLRKLGTPVDYKKYPAVGRGFGTGVGTSADGWINDAVTFWENNR